MSMIVEDADSPRLLRCLSDGVADPALASLFDELGAPARPGAGDHHRAHGLTRVAHHRLRKG